MAINAGIQPIYAGEKPAERVWNLVKGIRSFQPHFVQSTHFFSSFYAGIAGRITGVTSIGAIRSDLHLDLAGVGWSGPLMLRLPDVLLANSKNARENARLVGYPQKKVFVVQNVIDLSAFDRQQSASSAILLNPDHIYAITVARLVPVKRMERFLHALEMARRQVPNLVGVIVGDGPSSADLREQAEGLGLRPDQPSGGVRFLGERNDIPQLLSQSDLFVLTSDREGFPNVVLEAMAASLPVVTTPAGETPDLVTDGLNGFFVPFDDTTALAQRLVALAQSPSLRKRLGKEGRRIVENQFSYPRIKQNLVETYQAIARQVKNNRALSVLDSGITLESGSMPSIPESRVR